MTAGKRRRKPNRHCRTKSTFKLLFWCITRKKVCTKKRRSRS